MLDRSKVLSFKKELLSVLYKQSGENVLLNPLIQKYIGDVRVFEFQDNEPPENRDKINAVLQDLKNMSWILLEPKHGLNGANSQDPRNGGTFTYNENIYASLTTKGEIEYRKTVKNLYKSDVFVFIVYPVIAGLIVWAITTYTCNKQGDISKKSETTMPQKKGTIIKEKK